MSMLRNPIVNTDSYKCSQFVQYPPGTTNVYSYGEARGGKYKEVVAFGMQMFIKTYMSIQLTHSMIDKAETFIIGHGLPFNREGWEYIVDKHNGFMPLHIKAVPEGTVVPISNVIFTIENTDPNCFWLTSYVETALLRAIWYPTTVATKSRSIKRMLKHYLEWTADDEAMEGLPFKLHDFGGRGVSSKESAGLGGAAHLVNFMGTDTMEGIVYAAEYYNHPMAGFSVPASEHSTVTSWQRKFESLSYKNMFKQFQGDYPIISIVADSYDIFNAVENIFGDEMKQTVIDSGSVLVVRPDSGDPATVVLEIAKILKDKFGTVTNSKGYEVLNGVRILQGDGLNELDDIDKVLRALERDKFSTDNVVFGMGGGLLQQVNRDTCQFAMKCSSIVVDGKVRDVYKDPIGDSGKRSKRGRLSLVYKGGEFKTVSEEEAGVDDLLRVVYKDGKLHNMMDFSEVRHNAAL